MRCHLHGDRIGEICEICSNLDKDAIAVAKLAIALNIDLKQALAIFYALKLIVGYIR